MNFFQKLSTLPLYIKFFFTSVDLHYIQAPFAYQFVEELIHAMKSSSGFPQAERERRLLAMDKTAVLGKDYGAGSKLRKSTIASIARYGISSKKQCIFLREVANITKASKYVELGTSLGIATAYLASNRPNSKIYSFEGNHALAARAKALLIKLNISNVRIVEGNIDVELPTLLSEMDSLDFVIIDANHTRNALIKYYDLLKKKMISEGVIFVDDIRWSTDMYAGWKELCQRREVSLSLEFLDYGLLFFKKEIQKQHYVLAI